MHEAFFVRKMSDVGINELVLNVLKKIVKSFSYFQVPVSTYSHHFSKLIDVKAAN